MDEEKRAELEQKLKEEKALLEDELSTVGEEDPQGTDGWMAHPADMDVLEADSSERASAEEVYGENAAILSDLEIRYRRVKNALERMQDGTYGVCSFCGDEIEIERLEANPASPTCISHKEEEVE